MNFAHQMLFQITLDVCGSRLGLSGVRVLDQPERTQREVCLEGSIRITGEWEIELRVVCPKAVAVRLTTTMYDKITDDLSDENIRDALREVISVIGRDVKDALGGQSSLSYPRVRENVSDFEVDFPSGFNDFNGDVLTVHLADATQDAVLAL
ncbi:MAG: chemotaxis protein CheX [Planctomycetota bacterium]